MLDGNFPDEHVRKFAVNALHELPDDELEDILLQLTQVGGAYHHGNVTIAVCVKYTYSTYNLSLMCT